MFLGWFVALDCMRLTVYKRCDSIFCRQLRGRALSFLRLEQLGSKLRMPEKNYFDTQGLRPSSQL